MAITTDDQLKNALLNNSSRIVIDKASLSSRAVGDFVSMWRMTGQPGQGATPTAVAVCNDETVGGLRFNQQTAPATSYLGILESLCTNASHTLELHDRLAHQGGLSGTLTTAQTVSMDLSSLLATDDLDARKGDANYSDVQWWVEWYTDTGATAANLTVNVTYDDGTTGNLTALALAATRRASTVIGLNSLIPAAAAGKYIRGINTAQLSISTGTAGNFGFTATRYRAAIYMPVANARFTANIWDLGAPEVGNNSCLAGIVIVNTTTTGTIRATGKVIHG